MYVFFLKFACPNITGSFGSVMQQAELVRSGAFYTVAETPASMGINASTGRYDIGFDASRSNSIYGNSATVQPKSLNLSILIKYQYLIKTLRLRELGCTVVDAPQVEFDLEASKLTSYIAVEPEAETYPVLPQLFQDKQPRHSLLSPGELEGKKPNLPRMLGPNITGNWCSVWAKASTAESNPTDAGAFRATADGATKALFNGNADFHLNFDASRSSSIYGGSSTVQPKSLNLSFLIKY